MNEHLENVARVICDVQDGACMNHELYPRGAAREQMEREGYCDVGAESAKALRRAGLLNDADSAAIAARARAKRDEWESVLGDETLDEAADQILRSALRDLDGILGGVK